ncbi:hypothetical protein Sango_0371300 [Sesamum angolense]|uniref:Reverse transcriptase domain-containing protein n=1 Tax=Sesamum angolense TaxID=2727404 RepID=A0AAE1X9W7_9LAMI|nr:hypothetical protein Sango_0371300 [Sesamum angolense]
MTQYLKWVKEMIAKFSRCAIQQILRSENERVDVLSKFEAMASGIKDRKVTIMIKKTRQLQRLQEYKHWRKKAIGNPQANGQMEVTNCTILQHLKSRIEGAKGSWVDELPGVLWAYRMTMRSAAGETPLCLVYGTEAIIPAKIRKETQKSGV